MPSRRVEPKPSEPLKSSQLFPDPIPGVILFGSVNIFGGASGVGKTTVCVPLALALKAGADYFGRPTNAPTMIYYLAADRDWRTYHTKFAAAGYPDIPHYALPDDPTEIPKARRDGGQFELFERCLAKLAPIPGAVVFVDPVAPTFIRGDQNRAWNAATALHHYRWLAKLYRVTLICLSNVVKERTDAGFTRARDRISGSGALGAYSDTQFYLLNGQAASRRIFGWAPREEAEVEYVLRFNATTKLYEYESGPWDVGEAHGQSDDIGDTGRERELLAFIARAPKVSTTEAIITAATAMPKPIAERSVYRYLTVLEEAMLITKVAKGQYRQPSLLHGVSGSGSP